MSALTGPQLPPWQAANNGAGKRIWFLYRGDRVPFRHRYHCNARGDLIRYATFQSATAAAGQLNGDQAARCRTCGTLWTGLRDTDCNPLCYTCGLRPDLVTVDNGTGEALQVTPQEAAAGMVRYARRELGAGSPACGEVERQALTHSDGGRLRAQRGRRTGPAVFSHSDGARTRFTAAPHRGDLTNNTCSCRLKLGRWALREARLVPVQARPWSPPGCTRGQRTGTPQGVPVLAGSPCTAWSPLTLTRGRTVICDIYPLSALTRTLTSEASQASLSSVVLDKQQVTAPPLDGQTSRTVPFPLVRGCFPVPRSPGWRGCWVFWPLTLALFPILSYT